MQKYQVIKLDCVNHDCEILYTGEDMPLALEFMKEYINKTYLFDNSLKCQYNNGGDVSIYEYYYLFPKQLTTKIMIKIYEEYCD